MCRDVARFAFAEPERGAVEPHAVHDRRQLAGNCDRRALVTAARCKAQTHAFSPEGTSGAKQPNEEHYRIWTVLTHGCNQIFIENVGAVPSKVNAVNDLYLGVPEAVWVLKNALARLMVLPNRLCSARYLIQLAALVTAVVCGSAVLHADGMDAWSAQVSKASRPNRIVPPVSPAISDIQGPAQLIREAGSTWRCQDPNTYFVYTRPEPCAKGDIVIDGNDSHDKIRLVEEDGIYKVPVMINNILSLQFVLDSGASDVAIPEDVFSVLRRTGTVTNTDYIGTGNYRLGDGAVVQSDRFYLRELKIGSHVLNHVRASIGNKTSPLLLGQSFLKRFTSVQVDNGQHVLLLGPEQPEPDGLGSAAVAALPPGFVPVQPGPSDSTQPSTVVRSYPSPGDGTVWDSPATAATAPPIPIDLREIKLSEISRPYYLIHPETVRFIISNSGDQHISKITIGDAINPKSKYCPQSLSAYQGFKKFWVNLPPGDSVEVEGEFSPDAKWFCIIRAQ